MANNFYRVSASLRADKNLASMAGVATALALAGIWTAWTFWAHVTIYQTSEAARIEAAGASYPIQSAINGRVTSSHLTLGQQVRAGDVLVEVENEDVRLGLEMERTHAQNLTPQLDSLRQQIQAETAAQEDERKVLSLSQDGARAQWKQAEAEAALAAKEAERARLLRKEELISAADAERASGTAESKRSAAENLRAAIDRLGPELQVRERDREVKLKEMAIQAAALQAQIAESQQTTHRLEYDRDRRTVRAPVSGRVGECAVLRTGSHIAEGQQLGVILGSGSLQAVAEFAPSSALGRIFPGQPAIVRLNGFPWMQYGTVSAHVTRVAGEIRDGHVRVEMAMDATPNRRIALQHGLPGTVEVAVEQVTPLALLLRSVGVRAGAH